MDKQPNTIPARRPERADPGPGARGRASLDAWILEDAAEDLMFAQRGEADASGTASVPRTPGQSRQPPT